ncbi:MAG: hypothetical protein FJ304_00425 [Planctomycetes bacterium]|nr:hypothetical protein [Planctomycetota bacterium]
MGPLPIAQWNAALDDMETALTGAARALERSDERWELAGAPSAGEGEAPVALDRLDVRLVDWEARARAAEGVTRAAEAEIADRAEAVGRWRALFAQWEHVLQQEQPTHPAS